MSTFIKEEHKMKHAGRFPLVVMLIGAMAAVGASNIAAGTTEPSASAAQGASADTLPFKGSVSGRHVSRTPLGGPLFFDRFELEGQATHLGRLTLVIESTVNFGARPVTGSGTYTFTAANGDQLVASQSGTSALVRPGTVLITEHAVVDPDRSTGRFAGAEGTFTVERLADAATGVGGVTEGTLDGTISLAH